MGKHPRLGHPAVLPSTERPVWLRDPRPEPDDPLGWIVKVIRDAGAYGLVVEHLESGNEAIVYERLLDFDAPNEVPSITVVVVHRH